MIISKLPNLPLCIDNAYRNGNWKYYTMETHSHGFLECNYIENGSCIYEIDGKEYELGPKNFILLDSSLPHKMKFYPEKPCTVLGFSLSFDFSKPTMAFPGMLDIFNTSLELCLFFASFNVARIFPDGGELRANMLRLCKEFEGRKNLLTLNTLGYHILSEIPNLPANEKSSAQFYVEQAEDYIKESFYLIKSNEMIANHIGLNATYLERIYKKATGISLWESVTRCRLAAAKELLANPQIPIKEIDNMIGFANRQTFYLQFKKRYGISPSEYRKGLA